jgi:hypothetical protein
MTPRERILAMGVGAAVGLFGLQYSIMNIRGSLDAKQVAVDNAQAELDKAKLMEDAGFNAANKLNRLRSKSLPSDLSTLQAQYRDWLFTIGESSGLSNIKVVTPSLPIQTADAFKAYKFTLTGECRTDQVIDLLARFYDKDCLHSIETLKLEPLQGSTTILKVTLDSRALALNSADAKQKPSLASSGRLSMTAEEYKDAILNRNPFSPPNQPPRLATNRSQEIKLGDDWRLALEGTDPEQGRVEFELVTTEPPKGLELRRGELRWKPTEVGEYKVKVRATDDGWPRRSTEEQLTLRVVEPPKETPKVEPPKFDVASQAFVTMMVSGRRGPEAAIRSRTEGKTFALQEGSELEVGSVKAKVLSINLQEEFIELDSEGHRWLLDWNTSLADAYKKSQID